MKVLAAAAKFLWGVLLCQTAPTALLVVGWTYRLARRTTLERWRELSGVPVAEQSWPNWFLGARPGPAQRLVGALTANLRAGFSMWAATLPGSGLLYLGWANGWNTSFNRIYEDIALGPLTMLTGAALLVAALAYMPLALVHQAVSEDWRAFYRAGLVWRLVRQRPWASLGLAVLYVGLSLPLLLLTVLPAFLPNIDPRLERLTAGETAEFLNLYYLAAAVLVFPLFVAPRLVAARVYAGAVVAAVRRGRVGIDQLPGTIRERLGSVTMDQPRVRPAMIRWAGVAAGAAATAAVVLLTVMAWTGFVSQIVIAQFFHYRGALGWLNHPIVQLPWLRHIPDLPM